MYHKKIGRVHWFLDYLDKSIYRLGFRLYYNYAKHSYLLYRSHIVKPYDVIIVKRTSKRCFRLMYANYRNYEIIYKSFSNSRSCADFCLFLANSNIPP